MADRKVYTKPQVTSINLIPDEAVLGTCKTSTTSTGVTEVESCLIDSCTVAQS